MTTDITLFAQPQIAPVYLQNNPAAKALQEQLEGGLAGRQINRIALRNGKFRFLKAGVEIASIPGPLPVVIINANPTVGRLFWLKGFDPDDTGTRPDCYSIDGIKPEADSPAAQSPLCATCPKNAKGSGNDGKSKACSYKKRTIVVDPRAIGGDAYALDMGAMTMFGDDVPAARQFNLKSYLEALKANGLMVPAVVTQLAFDDEATVPKLLLTPLRVLTEAEFAQVCARLTDPLVLEMLNDVDRKSEEGKPVNAPAIAAPAPVQQAAAQAAQPPVATTPAPARRGRPKQAETPPQAAAAPSGFPAGNGATAAPAPAAPAGFPPPTAAAPVPAAAAQAGPPGFSIDLDKFDA